MFAIFACDQESLTTLALTKSKQFAYGYQKFVTEISRSDSKVRISNL